MTNKQQQQQNSYNAHFIYNLIFLFSLLFVSRLSYFYTAKQRQPAVSDLESCFTLFLIFIQLLPLFPHLLHVLAHQDAAHWHYLHHENSRGMLFHQSKILTITSCFVLWLGYCYSEIFTNLGCMFSHALLRFWVWNLRKIFNDHLFHL